MFPMLLSFALVHVVLSLAAGQDPHEDPRWHLAKQRCGDLADLLHIPKGLHGIFHDERKARWVFETVAAWWRGNGAAPTPSAEEVDEELLPPSSARPRRASTSPPTRICHLGLNYGCSAVLLLETIPNSVLYAFDAPQYHPEDSFLEEMAKIGEEGARWRARLGESSVTGEANPVLRVAEELGRLYSGDFQFFPGLSYFTLRSFARNMTAGRFGPQINNDYSSFCDVVFVDGSKDPGVRLKDLELFYRIASSKALVLVDEVIAPSCVMSFRYTAGAHEQLLGTVLADEQTPVLERKKVLQRLRPKQYVCPAAFAEQGGASLSYRIAALQGWFRIRQTGVEGGEEQPRNDGNLYDVGEDAGFDCSPEVAFVTHDFWYQGATDRMCVGEFLYQV